MSDPAQPRRTKILIVDDDASIREVLATQLERLSYDTAVASDGEEGIALFERERPDLVLLDLMMPTMDGLKACQKMRALEKKGARVPIVFLTARDGTHDKLSTTLSGGDDFVSKPISLEELRERVEAALARARRPQPRPK
jgi:DNA-binding response OmpR family regulator